MTIKEQNKQEAKNYILSIINKIREDKKEPELLIFVKSVSRSGMSRQMIVMLDNKDITYYVNNLLEYSNKNNYIRVGGCGMNMTFWLADYITSNLYDEKPKWLSGNGGGSVRCLKWKSVY